MIHMRTRTLLCWGILGSLAAAACGAAGAMGDSADGDYPGDPTTGYAPGAGGTSLGNNDTTGSLPGGSAGTTGHLPGEELLPEEVEDPQDYRVPVATGRYLWSANPGSGRVALIDAVHLSVQVLSAGLSPTHLAPVPSEREGAEALLINTGSSDVTRYIVEDGKVRQHSVPIHPGANRLTTSARFAVAWSAPQAGTILDPTEGLQELTVLRLRDDGMDAKRLAVGYRPSQVQIAEEETHIHVVSAEGITRVELDDDPEADAWVDLGFDAEGLDVALSQDGKYALVREPDAESIDIVDLFDPTLTVTLRFAGPVTDVDLAPTGRAVVVIRETRQVATFLLSEVLEDDSKVFEQTLPDQVFGSAVITDDGARAVLYTNVVANPTINLVQLQPGQEFLSFRQISTQSPVFSVVPTPGGKHAVVLAGNGSGLRTSAFSVVALEETRFPRVVGTGASVDRVAVADDFAVVTASSKDGGLFEAHTVALPGLTVDSFELASAPLAAGVLPEFSLGYVAQDHAEGRVTFFDFDKDDVKTLTGFELSAEVVDE